MRAKSSDRAFIAPGRSVKWIPPPAKQRASAGRAGDEYLVQAERPSAEPGERVVEEFELAEADLIEAAETAAAWADPCRTDKEG